MSLGKSIYTALSSETALTNIIGTKIFPVIIPQAEDVPAICYWKGSKDPNPTNDGPSRLDKVTINIHIVSKTYDQLETISDIVRTTLESFTDLIVQSARFNTESDDYDAEGKAYIRNQTYTIREKRLIPVSVTADNITITSDSISITADTI